MAMAFVSLVLPQILPGNNQSISKKIFFLEDKATVRSFQMVTCRCTGSIHNAFSKASAIERARSVEVRAMEPKTEESLSTPSSGGSLLCKKCEGNGVIVCSQCKGDGKNKVDFFNGHFKAGSICWLCRGKREILCGECNGAGFIGGFMNALED